MLSIGDGNRCACDFIRMRIVELPEPSFGGKFASWLTCSCLQRTVGNTRIGKMWIQVRSMDGQKNVRIDNLSKLTKIEDLRIKLVDHFNADPERQRLFFRGKQVSSFMSFVILQYTL